MNATQTISLWMANDQGVYTETAEIAAAHVNEPQAWTLADALRDHFHDLTLEVIAPDIGGTFVGDLVTHALADVDWREIAEQATEAAKNEDMIAGAR